MFAHKALFLWIVSKDFMINFFFHNCSRPFFHAGYNFSPNLSKLGQFCGWYMKFCSGLNYGWINWKISIYSTLNSRFSSFTFLCFFFIVTFKKTFYFLIIRLTKKLLVENYKYCFWLSAIFELDWYYFS